MNFYDVMISLDEQTQIAMTAFPPEHIIPVSLKDFCDNPMILANLFAPGM